MKKKIQIFGYGSLINHKTRKITLKKKTKSIPVIFNDPKFTRKWICLKKKNKNKNRSVLTLYRNKNKNLKENINGILFPIDNNKLLKTLNKREGSYNLIKLNKKYFKSYNNKKIPKKDIYSYISKQKYKTPNKTCKVNQHYIDVTIDGLSNFGKSFASKFNTSVKKKYIKHTRKKKVPEKFKFIKKINTKKIDKLIKQINLNRN